MSLRLEMLQVARLAPKVLGESSHLVREFLQRQQNLDGGFKDRSGRSDLYYTVFGLDGCVALQKDFNALQVESYLSPFGNGEGLDFVHLCCLARCWAAVGRFSSAFTDPCLKRIEGFRSADGGYNPVEGSSSGTAYGCFLAMGAYQDLGEPLPEPTGISHCLQTLQTDDGAWANESGVRRGATNATAAAVTLLRQSGIPMDARPGDWLLARCHPQGGFLAMANAPLPDLLSTATALHALAGLQVPLERLKERCLDFIDSLWTNEGGFHGHWEDDTLDCEYTFYGLLALGHLSLY